MDVLALLNYEDAIKILDKADPQKAADYRTVISAVERLPMWYSDRHPNMRAWEIVREIYRNGAIEDALKALANHYLRNECSSANSAVDLK